MDSLRRKQFFKNGSFDQKQNQSDSLGGSLDRETKIGRLVYTVCT